METIIDTFYKRIIPGIATGKIQCGIDIRIISNVLFVENNKLIEAKSPVEGLNIPTLKINNKMLLESLISRYVSIMRDFEFPHKDTIDEEDLDAYIIACALANMSLNDYEQPESYFSKLCYVHNNNPIENQTQDLGYSESLKGNLSISIENDALTQECPFVFRLLLDTELGLYEFPVIRYYVIDNTAFIGAIQNTKSSKDKTFNKKVRRRLYKVNEGLEQESPLMEVDPSTVCSLTSFAKFLEKHNITNIELLPYNIQRSNDKKIQAYYLNQLLENPQEKYRAKITEVIHKSTIYFERLPQIRNQLETALYRMNYHFPNTNIINGEMPSIIIANLDNCNNELLNEICTAVSIKKTR